MRNLLTNGTFLPAMFGIMMLFCLLVNWNGHGMKKDVEKKGYIDSGLPPNWEAGKHAKAYRKMYPKGPRIWLGYIFGALMFAPMVIIVIMVICARS